MVLTLRVLSSDSALGLCSVVGVADCSSEAVSRLVKRRVGFRRRDCEFVTVDAATVRGFR